MDAGAPELTFQPGDEVQSPFSKGTSGAGAWLAGVPFLYTEATGSGGIWNRDIDLYSQGVRNLLRHLGISPGEPVPPTPGQVVVEDFDPGSGNLQHQHVTPVGGLFHAEVDLYGRVEQGQRLGTVRDLFGEVIYEVKASRAGVLITIRHVARVSAGDALANIAPNAGPPEDEPVLLH